MCMGAKPKMVKPPAPVLQPLQPNKVVDVKRGADSRVASKGKTRRRGTARKDMIINRNPAGVNRPTGSGGVGVYS